MVTSPQKLHHMVTCHTVIHQKFTLPTPKQGFKFSVIAENFIGLFQLHLLRYHHHMVTLPHSDTFIHHKCSGGQITFKKELVIYSYKLLRKKSNLVKVTNLKKELVTVTFMHAAKNKKTLYILNM